MCNNQSTASNSSDKIKDIINAIHSKKELAKLAKMEIEQSIEESFSGTGNSPLNLLGHLVSPFHGSTEVLQTFSLENHISDVTRLLIFLADVDNLKLLPEDVQEGVTTALAKYLHFLQAIEEYTNECFRVADLYNISRWEHLTHKEFKALMEQYIKPSVHKHI
jgi:hypothetical protein